MDRQTFEAAAMREQRRERDARALHWRTTVVLGYNNIPLRPTAGGFDPGPILGDTDLCATSVHRLILGGVKVIVWSPGIPFWNASWQALGGRAKVAFHQKQYEIMNGIGRQTDGLLQVARNGAEIRKINAAGGIAVLLHLSGVCHLNDMAILRETFGPEIVGYGPDYECTFQHARGIEEADKTPNLTRALRSFVDF